ncbi:MAG: Alanine-tRNA ligase [Parcubacteria group bacterium GW2011_GWA1_42_7]|nr:MAG: Alanine-tRNA ligase [Parcubacteria group bacterium GW2011_GWB1_42_6]KKS70177.1 MAG: Alanine-tRNA ligase [Parcubacteria group bacterium GW2011_GWA1_42_7]KKS92425.1 MAG: Alanine-tRNA ligase [Parcubacteria group bacterium GW2011_GWC1_43_12]
MTAKELRGKYLEFFKARGHAVIPSASLVPQNDPTVLFTTAGMQPLVPYLLGEKHPQGKRLVNVQKCLRTNDIDEVGDATHGTFFEMLGNWSLGDYFKKESLSWSYEFLTSPEWLGLDKNRLAVSVFAGDDDAPFDEEAFEIWRSLGISEKRITRLPKENNWWGPAGETGPCGPDSEIFYWTGAPDQVPESFNDDNDLWVEIWNNVFMQYNKNIKGSFEPLAQKNVDTGLGLERALVTLNGYDEIYKIDVIRPIIEKIEEISGKKYDETISEIPLNPPFTKGGNQKAMRIVADHLKASAFLIADGVEPSNTERGYVLRRLIRRAVRYGRQLGIEGIFCFKIARVAIEIYKDIYPELSREENSIEEQLTKEEEKFAKTLESGLKQFENVKIKIKNDSAKSGIISGEIAFNLYQTYGFPVELTKELAKEAGLEVDEEKFKDEMKRHQELSRAGAEQKFKGGLADHSEQTVKYHTAAHLLLAALRQTLGGDVNQRGANITSERLRFDFSHPQKMTPEQIKEVEDLVNEKIKEDLPVACEEMALDEAKAKGATGIFDSKYGERVKVYTIGSPSTGPSTGSGQCSGSAAFSREICGGPHVERTGVLGNFKIVKEESCSAGVRRIKAVLK